MTDKTAMVLCVLLAGGCGLEPNQEAGGGGGADDLSGILERLDALEEEVDAKETRIADLEAALEASYATVAYVDAQLAANSTGDRTYCDEQVAGIEAPDLSLYALDADLTVVDGRLMAVEADYVTESALSANSDGDRAYCDTQIGLIPAPDFTPYALVVDLDAVEGRVGAIEADYVLHSELAAYVPAEDLGVLDDRLSLVEDDYVVHSELASNSVDDRDYCDGLVDAVAGVADELDALSAYIEVDSELNAVRFVGANVYIQNGMGATNGNPADPGSLEDWSANSYGNLIIGYGETNEPSDSSGSHNLVVGTFNDYSSVGSLVSGIDSKVEGPYSAALGHGNHALALGATALGGYSNLATEMYASSVGGSWNVSSGRHAVSLGGTLNDASGDGSLAAGGTENSATGLVSIAAGGVGNTVTSVRAGASLGGINNAVSGDQAVAVGGSSNRSMGHDGVTVGGFDNTANSTDGCVMGGASNSFTGGSGSVLIAGQHSNIPSIGEYNWVMLAPDSWSPSGLDLEACVFSGNALFQVDGIGECSR